MQNNGAFNVLSAANSIPSWNLGLQPSTSHSDSGGSAGGMLPSSTVRQPIRDGQFHAFGEKHGSFTPMSWMRRVRNIFYDVECRSRVLIVILCIYELLLFCIQFALHFI